MVTILKYVFLGILLYTLIIPILEQLAVVLCQGLEVIKGRMLLTSALLQKKIDDISKEEETTQSFVHAIGFQAPIEEEYYEEDEDEDDD